MLSIHEILAKLKEKILATKDKDNLCNTKDNDTLTNINSLNNKELNTNTNDNINLKNTLDNSLTRDLFVYQNTNSSIEAKNLDRFTLSQELIDNFFTVLKEKLEQNCKKMDLKNPEIATFYKDNYVFNNVSPNFIELDCNEIRRIKIADIKEAQEKLMPSFLYYLSFIKDNEKQDFLTKLFTNFYALVGPLPYSKLGMYSQDYGFFYHNLKLSFIAINLYLFDHQKDGTNLDDKDQRTILLLLFLCLCNGIDDYFSNVEVSIKNASCKKNIFNKNIDTLLNFMANSNDGYLYLNFNGADNKLFCNEILNLIMQKRCANLKSFIKNKETLNLYLAKQLKTRHNQTQENNNLLEAEDNLEVSLRLTPFFPFNYLNDVNSKINFNEDSIWDNLLSYSSSDFANYFISFLNEYNYNYNNKKEISKADKNSDSLQLNKWANAKNIVYIIARSKNILCKDYYEKNPNLINLKLYINLFVIRYAKSKDLKANDMQSDLFFFEEGFMIVKDSALYFQLIDEILDLDHSFEIADTAINDEINAKNVFNAWCMILDKESSIKESWYLLEFKKSKRVLIKKESNTKKASNNIKNLPLNNGTDIDNYDEKLIKDYNDYKDPLSYQHDEEKANYKNFSSFNDEDNIIDESDDEEDWQTTNVKKRIFFVKKMLVRAIFFRWDDLILDHEKPKLRTFYEKISTNHYLSLDIKKLFLRKEKPVKIILSELDYKNRKYQLDLNKDKAFIFYPYKKRWQYCWELYKKAHQIENINNNILKDLRLKMLLDSNFNFEEHLSEDFLKRLNDEQRLINSLKDNNEKDKINENFYEILLNELQENKGNITKNSTINDLKNEENLDNNNENNLNNNKMQKNLNSISLDFLFHDSDLNENYQISSSLSKDLDCKDPCIISENNGKLKTC